MQIKYLTKLQWEKMKHTHKSEKIAFRHFNISEINRADPWPGVFAGSGPSPSRQLNGTHRAILLGLLSAGWRKSGVQKLQAQADASRPGWSLRGKTKDLLG